MIAHGGAAVSAVRAHVQASMICLVVHALRATTRRHPRWPWLRTYDERCWSTVMLTCYNGMLRSSVDDAICLLGKGHRLVDLGSRKQTLQRCMRWCTTMFGG